MRAYREHTVTAPVAIIVDNSRYSLHRVTCSRIARAERSRSVGVSIWRDLIVGQTLADYAESTFGDIASDRHAVGSPEWSGACWDEWANDLTICACAEECIALAPPAPVSAPVAPAFPVPAPVLDARHAETRARLLGRLAGITVREASYLCALSREELHALISEA